MPAAPTWNLKYRISFTNEHNELCIVHLSSKTDNGDLVNLQADEAAVTISWPNSEEDKFSPIRGSEAVIKILVYDSYGIDLSTFIGPDDEWKVDYYKADLAVTNGQGFLVQEEHVRDMQDEPYNLELHATDGLGLLKDRALTNCDGEKYTGLNFLLDYAGDILWQVNPYLKLVTHINVFNIAHDDRDISPEKDPWLQTKVQARSWLKDATTFEDCYSVLEKMLFSWGLTLYQWNGAWHIMDLWDVMRGETSYTVYNYDLDHPTDAHIRTVESSAINEVFEAKIAPHGSTTWSGPVSPEGEDQLMGLKFANKSVRLFYNYGTWPELPANNKFEYGTQEAVHQDATHKTYILDSWEYGKVDWSTGIPFSLTPPTHHYHLVRTYDAFGVEISRELAFELPDFTEYPTNSEENWLRSEGIPVTAGDKISISAQWKVDPAWGSSAFNPVPMHVYIVNEAGTQFYGLMEDEFNTPPLKGHWSLGDVGGLYTANNIDDFVSYSLISSESQPIPVNGTLYIVFVGFTTNDANQIAYFTDFQFSYMPYTAGGYRQVKGESRLIAQDAEYKQKSDEEIFLNDCIHGVVKGAMYRYSNVTDSYILTSPLWYRYTYTGEDRTFIEIQALKRFWHTYRAMQKIEGTFSGLIFFGDTELPLGLITILYPEWLGTKKYMLTNMEQDHKQANFTATMIEKGVEADATEPDTNEHQYIFE